MPKLYVGLDVSLELTSVCAVDEDGVIRLETKAISDPAAIAAMLRTLDGAFERVGLEAGPLSQWLYFGLRDAGLPAVCIEARHAKAAIGAMNANSPRFAAEHASGGIRLAGAGLPAPVAAP